MSDTPPPPEDWTDRRAVEAWLRTQPREASVALAARAALRTMPLLYPPSEEEEKKFSSSVCLPFFCATSAAVVTLVSSKKNLILRERISHAAEFAFTGITTISLVYAAALAADMASGWVDIDDDMSFARDSALSIGAAVSYARSFYLLDPNAIDSCINQISCDASNIDGGNGPEIANRSLWWDEVPDWFSTRWDELKQFLLSNDEIWEVWTDWYDARLRGDPVDVELETKRVSLAERWDGGPAAVNAEIKAIIEEHEASKRGSQGSKNDSAPNEDLSIDDLLASPILQTAYADFEIEEDTGTVRMVPMRGDLPAVTDPDLALDWRSRLEGLSITPRALIEDIRESGRNVPPSLFRDLDRYAEEADRGPDVVRPGVLDMFGRYIVAAGENEDIFGALGDYLGTKLTEVGAAHRRLMHDYHAQVTRRLHGATADLPDDATPEAVSASIEAISESLKAEPWAGLHAPTDFTDLLDAQKEAFRAAATAVEVSAEAKERAAIQASLQAEEVSTLATIGRFVFRLGECVGSRSPLARRVGYAGSLASLAGLAEMAVPGSVIPHLSAILRWLGLA